MTSDEKRLVQQSWALAAPHADQLAQTFYARVFELDPDCQMLFASTDMTEQRRKLVAMLGVIVHMIDEPKELVPVTASLGRRHVEYRVQDRDYDTVGAALIWAFRQTLGSAFTDEVASAWGQAYALLASVMKRGAGAQAA